MGSLFLLEIFDGKNVDCPRFDVLDTNSSHSPKTLYMLWEPCMVIL